MVLFFTLWNFNLKKNLMIWRLNIFQIQSMNVVRKRKLVLKTFKWNKHVYIGWFLKHILFGWQSNIELGRWTLWRRALGNYRVRVHLTLSGSPAFSSSLHLSTRGLRRATLCGAEAGEQHQMSACTSEWVAGWCCVRGESSRMSWWQAGQFLLLAAASLGKTCMSDVQLWCSS